MANQPKKYKKFVATAATATLVASAIVPVASAASLSDIAGNTHEAAINALVDAGVISGYPDGTFQPNKQLTRSDVVKLLGKYLVTEGYEVPSDYKTNPRFADLTSASNDELLKYAAVVADAGVFAGSNGKLLAGDAITRENMAIVLVRMVNTLNDVSLEEFVASQDFTREVKDINAAKAEARTAIDVLDFYDITTVANFLPKNTVTRGQFATFLNNVINADFAGAAATTGVVKAINNTTVEVTFAEKVEDIKNLDIAIEGLEVKNAVVKLTDNKTVVVTTSVQEAGKEYTVVIGGKEVGKFTGVSAILPKTVKLTANSQQAVYGQQVTVKAEVTVEEGQSKDGIQVTFVIANNGLNATPSYIEAITKDGVAEYTYTRYTGSEDTVTAYATAKADIRDTNGAKVYWANAARLTVEDITKDTTIVNNGQKVYQIKSSENRNGYVYVTFEENLNKTPDKLVRGVKAEGSETYLLNGTGNIASVTTAKYPYIIEKTGTEQVIAVKLDGEGKANLVLTGSNATVTPIVYANQSTGVGAPIGLAAGYSKTALQATASKVTFEVKHALGLKLEAKGVQYSATWKSNTETGGRDYVINYTRPDGTNAAVGSSVRVAIPKEGLDATANFRLYDAKGNVVNSVSNDASNLYYNIVLDKPGQATFTVTSLRENDFVAPVAFIDSTTNGLDKNDLQATAEMTIFTNTIEYKANLKALDTASQLSTSKEVTTIKADGTTPAYFIYQLADQNGKQRSNANATSVTFNVVAGEGRLLVDGQLVQPGQTRQVTKTFAAGATSVSIPVVGLEASSATVTAIGSNAGVVLTVTDPASKHVVFSNTISPAGVTGDVFAFNLINNGKTFGLQLTDGAAFYNYTGQKFKFNETEITETEFEHYLGLGAKVSVTEENGVKTFKIIATGAPAIVTVDGAVDYLVAKAVAENATSVTVTKAAIDALTGAAALSTKITINTSANITINIDATVVSTGDLDVTAPNAHVNNAGTFVNVTIFDVSNTSFVNTGTITTATIKDVTGSKFENKTGGAVGQVVVDTTGAVTLTGDVPFVIVVTKAANITLGTGFVPTSVKTEGEGAKATVNGSVLNSLVATSATTTTADSIEITFSDNVAGAAIEISIGSGVGTVTAGSALNKLVAKFASALTTGDTVTVKVTTPATGTKPASESTFEFTTADGKVWTRKN